MDGDQKKSLKIAISEFYKLNIDKGKEYTIKNFKNGGIPKPTVYKWLAKIERAKNGAISFNRLIFSSIMQIKTV